MKSPRVSIIISAYNATKYLPATVNSVLQQTFSNFEVLIFNNGSSDNIAQWFQCLRDLRLRDLRFKLISQQYLGIFETRNLGITAARGEYVAFLDADDLWHPRKLQKQVSCFEHYPEVGLVHSWLKLIDSWGNSTGRVVKNNLSGWVEPKILKRNQIGSQSVMIRRRCFDSVGLFDPQLGTAQDWDMWIRLSRRYPFMSLAEPLTYSRQHPDRFSKNLLMMETSFQVTIEKAYAVVPSGLLYLKNLSYAHVSLFLAEKVLQSKDPDSVIAQNYCRQALEQSPHIGCSAEFLQLSLAVMMLHYLKSDRYKQLVLWFQATRVLLQAIANKGKIHTRSFLTWMLEEEASLSYWIRRKIKHLKRLITNY